MSDLEPRGAAADYLVNILVGAFETVTVEEIEKAFDVDFDEAMSILYEMGSASAMIYWEPVGDDPFAEIRVGDNDVTMDMYEEDMDSCTSTDGRWLCTRTNNHPGQHIAGDGHEVVGVWE